VSHLSSILGEYSVRLRFAELLFNPIFISDLDSKRSTIYSLQISLYFYFYLVLSTVNIREVATYFFVSFHNVSIIKQNLFIPFRFFRLTDVNSASTLQLFIKNIALGFFLGVLCQLRL